MSAGYAFAAVVARAFMQPLRWPADVRGAETDYIGGGLVTDLPIEPFRTDSGHAWVRPPLDIVLSDRVEAAAGRSRADAAFGAALRRGGGILGGAQPAGAGDLYRRDGGRGRCQCAAFGADQLDAVRLALRPLHQDHRPRHGRIVQDGRGSRAQLQAWLVSYVNTNLSAGRRCGRAIRWSRPRHGSRTPRATGGVSAASSSCSRTFSLTTCRPRSGSSPISPHREPVPEGNARQCRRRSRRPAELFRAGNLDDAIAAANAEVRRKARRSRRPRPAWRAAGFRRQPRTRRHDPRCRRGKPIRARRLSSPNSASCSAPTWRGGNCPRWARARVPRRADRAVARRLGAQVALRGGDAGEAARQRRGGRGAPAARTGQPEAGGGEVAFDDFRDADDLCAGFFEVLTTNGKVFLDADRAGRGDRVPPAHAAARSALAARDDLGQSGTGRRGVYPGDLRFRRTPICRTSSGSAARPTGPTIRPVPCAASASAFLAGDDAVSDHGPRRIPVRVAHERSRLVGTAPRHGAASSCPCSIG